ncbi:LolA family protein [Chitinimonas lacunae]|uniref:Outer membrane lipoprotein carrier protein LolA n=1 Tax=Chitinimonas lacunae TaxID=1963018 RepID=A0ABV8MUE8_9NEIS
MIRLVLGLWLLLAGFAVSAADLATSVKGRLADAPLLRGQFDQQKTVRGFKKPLASSGDFLLWRGRGVLWHTRQPFELSMTLTPDALSARQGEAAYRLDAGQEPGLRAVNELLFALLSGDMAALQRRFRVEGELVGNSGWKLLLTPLDAQLARLLRRVELEGDRYVRRVRLEESNGDASLIRFEQLAEAPPATPDEARRLGQ